MTDETERKGRQGSGTDRAASRRIVIVVVGGGVREEGSLAVKRASETRKPSAARTARSLLQPPGGRGRRRRQPRAGRMVCIYVPGTAQVRSLVVHAVQLLSGCCCLPPGRFCVRAWARSTASEALHVRRTCESSRGRTADLASRAQPWATRREPMVTTSTVAGGHQSLQQEQRVHQNNL